MSAYEDKRAARIERMRRRADGRDAEAARLSADVQQMGETMNGQPILVGHHSEKRHRRDFDRMHRKIRQSCDASDEAATLRSRARAAERNTAVSNDDPDAIAKLERKIAKKEAFRDQCKAVNKRLRAAVRAAKKTGANWKPVARKYLLELGLSDMAAEVALEADYAGRTGVPSYVLTNASSDIRRLKKRLAELEARDADGPRGDETIGNVEISEDAEANRVRVFFPGKPAADVRSFLKSNGFHWSPSVGAWQRHTSETAWHLAREAATLATEKPS